MSAARNRSPEPARWIGLAIATVATWLPIAWLSTLAATQPRGRVDQAEFLAAAGETIPTAEAGWQPVTLPDDWHERRPGVREGWYRLRFDVAATDEPRWAVYLPVVSMNASAHVNGERIGDGGRFEDPVARNWNRPLLLSFPSELLHPGPNTLHLRVKADLRDAGLLPAPAIGPQRELQPAFDRAEFIRRPLLWILVVLRLVVAAFTAAIWAMRRKEAFYGWVALTAIAWVLAELNLLVIDIPVSMAAWYWLFSVAIGWWGVCAVRLVLSFVGVSKPRAERGLTIFAVAGSLALAVFAASGSPYFYSIGVNLWLTLTFVSSCYLFRGVVPLLRNYPDEIEFNVVFVVALSVIGCVLFDLVMQLGLRPRGGVAAPAYISPVAVGGIGWVLVRRFVGAFSQSRLLVATLEERVREKHAELETSYRKIRETDRARVLSEERGRILHDMDEGLGSQLVSTLAMIDWPDASAQELCGAVRAALDDLRLVIDSLDPLEGELLPAIGMLRTRMQPRLHAAGVHVDWRVEDLPPIADLTPHRALQILRILQDAFGLALSRPGTRSLRVRTGSSENEPKGSAMVEIRDDASEASLPESTVARMRARAREIGARLEIESSASGSIVRLSIPTRAPHLDA